MYSRMNSPMQTAALILLFLTLSAAVHKETGSVVEEFCQWETFHPRCLKNEVILMKSATYGRMSIGRCLTAEEVAAQRLLAGDDPRVLGCSADVQPFLDRKCSGKTACEIRVVDMSHEGMKPCYPGLTVYLEASYSCITVVDEERSCAAIASLNPIHIIYNSASKGICGTKLQPWIVEAPVGQKVSITFLDFTASGSHPDPEGRNRSFCQSHGVILDRIRKQNTSICGGSHQREKEIYLSAGNMVQIFFNEDRKEVLDDGRQYLLRVQAVGCSDIIPPEDTWLKRTDDTIQIGCYSSRQTWQLSCKGVRWIGVLGNCSTDDERVNNRIEKLEHTSKLSDNAQVLAIVAIGGFTLAICLSIVCVGAICLRKFYSKSKKQEYKTLNYCSTLYQGRDLEQRNSLANDISGCGIVIQQNNLLNAIDNTNSLAPL